MSDKEVFTKEVVKPPTLFLLMEQEKDRLGGDAGLNILSIYKSREDCETVIKEHKKKSSNLRYLSEKKS